MTDILLTTGSLRRRGQKTSFHPAENEGSVCSCPLTGFTNVMSDVTQLIELHREVDERLGQFMSLELWEINDIGY